MDRILPFLAGFLACLALKAHAEAFPSTYQAPVGPPVLLKNATVLTGDGSGLITPASISLTARWPG